MVAASPVNPEVLAAPVAGENAGLLQAVGVAQVAFQAPALAGLAAVLFRATVQPGRRLAMLQTTKQSLPGGAVASLPTTSFD